MCRQEKGLERSGDTARQAGQSPGGQSSTGLKAGGSSLAPHGQGCRSPIRLSAPSAPHLTAQHPHLPHDPARERQAGTRRSRATRVQPRPSAMTDAGSALRAAEPVRVRVRRPRRRDPSRAECRPATLTVKQCLADLRVRRCHPRRHPCARGALVDPLSKGWSMTERRGVPQNPQRLRTVRSQSCGFCRLRPATGVQRDGRAPVVEGSLCGPSRTMWCV